MTDNADTDPDIVRASGQDPHNAILNTEKQADIGMATSGVNPGMTATVTNGWVSIQSNESVIVPGAFSTDPSFNQQINTGTIGGTGVDPTGAGDTVPVGNQGGYGSHKVNPIINDPSIDPNLFGVL